MIAVLKDVRNTIGLDGLAFVPELSILGSRSDVWVIQMGVQQAVQGLPRGAGEVKKPGPGALSDPNMAGQLYDYLVQLR